MSNDQRDDELPMSNLQDGEIFEKRRYKLLSSDDGAIIEQTTESFTQVDCTQEILGSNRLQTAIENRIADLDRILSAQLDLIMHHPDFQRLEASWRGLYFLVHEQDRSHDFAKWESVKFRVISVSMKDLRKEQDRSVQFDQSGLFYRIYENVFGGVEDPFSCLIGDYEFGQSPQDVSLLEFMSNIAAVAHAPFIASAAPEMFGLATFADIGQPRDLKQLFEGDEYLPWMRFRQSDASRYVALAIPHTLLRLPYCIREVDASNNAFGYQEDVSGKDRNKYLWGNAAYALATRITAAYAEHGWLAEIVSEKEGDPMLWSMSSELAGGLVHELPTVLLTDESESLERQSPLDGWITDRREFELSHLGFIAPQVYEGCVVFFGNQSCHKPKQYENPEASFNAIVSSQIRCVLCGSLFARSLLSLVRDASFLEPVACDECESLLNCWINLYTIAGPEMASLERLAKHPLRVARVEVREAQGTPGCYDAILDVWLEFQFRFSSDRPKLRFVVKLLPGKLKSEENESEQKQRKQPRERHLTDNRKCWWRFWK